MRRDRIAIRKEDRDPAAIRGFAMAVPGPPDSLRGCGIAPLDRWLSQSRESASAAYSVAPLAFAVAVSAIGRVSRDGVSAPALFGALAAADPGLLLSVVLPRVGGLSVQSRHAQIPLEGELHARGRARTRRARWHRAARCHRPHARVPRRQAGGLLLRLRRDRRLHHRRAPR